MIYFVRAGKHVKIGVAEDPRSRFATLQTASPVDLEMMAIAPGSFAEESAYHKSFSANRKRGEWYKITPEIREVVNGIRAQYPELQWARYNFDISPSDAVRLVVNTAVTMREHEPGIRVTSVEESSRGPGVMIWIPGYVSNGETIIVADAPMVATAAPQEEQV